MEYSGSFKDVEFSKGWHIVEDLRMFNLIKDGV